MGVADPQGVGVPQVLTGMDDVPAEVGVDVVKQRRAVDAAVGRWRLFRRRRRFAVVGAFGWRRWIRFYQ